jgi:hypothetical protein
MTSLAARMAATGIGFAGIDGVWWLPAAQPFPLPVAAQSGLVDAGRAIFALLDAVRQLFDTPTGDVCGLTSLLLYKTPDTISQWRDRSPVTFLRPDFQLTLDNQTLGSVGFAATELEICPSAQGYAHAMQVGYNLPTDLADAFEAFLDRRELLFVSTHQWSEFLFEQLAFCRALAERGVHAHLLLDRPIAAIADDALHERCWQPPIFGVRRKPANWNPDVLSRLRRAGLEEFIYPRDDAWPAAVGSPAVFRFGYLECFSERHLGQMMGWQRNGATFLNPISFIYDSKVLMAALAMDPVRIAVENSTPGALAVLDRVIPETLLLTNEVIQRVQAEKDDWVIKFAGFDGGNQAWGGRSLLIGAQCSRSEWEILLTHAAGLSWPVVAQRIVPSLKIEIDYYDGEEQHRTLKQGATRLRVFFMRGPSGAVIPCGAHVTVSGGTMQVSEGTDAVQTPVAWGGE